MKARIYAFLGGLLLTLAGFGAFADDFLPEQPPIEMRYNTQNEPAAETAADASEKTPFVDWPQFQMERSTVQETDELTEQIVKYTAPDGKLQVKLDVRTYRDFPVWEYTVWLTNLSKDAPTGVISDVNTFCTNIPLPQSGKEVTLDTICGSKCRGDDFVPDRKVISNGDAVSLMEFSGRSSNGRIPFLDLSFDENSGRIFAVGWSGSWNATFNNHGDSVSVTTGMSPTRFRLAPGETIRQPSITIFKREGMSRRAFLTVVHRFMLTHKVPRNLRDGSILPPILAVASGGGNKTPQMMLDVLEYCNKNQLPFDTYWIDAGWYGAPHEDELYSNCGPNWWKYAGDWRINTTTHPTGDLLPIAEAVHAKGMKLLLWFEPERMQDDAPILETHPEFRNGNLVDYGNPEALRWIQETVYGIIEKHHVDVYRQDFNMDPQGIWNLMELSPESRGLAQARHITGMYRFLDEMRERFPEILLENCASGGRRIDIEMISRAHTYCRSDYFIGRKSDDSAFILGQNATLNTLAFLPFQGCEFNCVPIGDDYGAFSIISSGTVITPSDFDGGVIRRDFTPDETAWFQKIFGVAERMKPYFLGDFYPLTDACAAANDLWCAWQFDRTDLEAGFALAFRRAENAEETRTFQLGNIDPNAQYNVETYGGASCKMDGAALQNWSPTLSPRSFQLIFYQKTPPK